MGRVVQMNTAWFVGFRRTSKEFGVRINHKNSPALVKRYLALLEASIQHCKEQTGTD